MKRRVAALIAAGLALPAAAKPVDEEIAVTAERLNRGTVRAEAAKFLRQAMADTRNGQNARWTAPLCISSIGVTEAVGRIFEQRVGEVARHVGLDLAKPGCAPNLVLAFTPDALALVKAVRKRDPRAVEGLSADERRRLMTPGLPVRWWHYSRPESSDGRQFAPAGFGAGAGIAGDASYNNYARASRIDEPTRVAMTGAVVVVEIGRIGAVSVPALADYLALVSLTRLRMDPANRPRPSILQLFDPGGGVLAGFSPQDELFIESLYRTRGNLNGAQQRAAMAGYIADETMKASAPPK